MGDIIETTVNAMDPPLYYKVSSEGMWFDIKTQNQAFIELRNKQRNQSLYYFQFQNPGIISICGRLNEDIKTVLPFALSQDEYTRFSLAWDTKFLWIGIGDNRRVISHSQKRTYTHFTEPVYVTFSTKDRLHPASFRFEVPPLILKTLKQPVEPENEKGNLYWALCHNRQLPKEAVIGGFINGEIVYIIRACFRDSLTPGVFVPSKGEAYVPWGGNANLVTEFEALCGYNLIWKPASSNRIPVDALIGGYSEVSREPLYIGRGKENDDKIPGKVQLSLKTCYIPTGGKETAVKQFEVLTVPGLNAHCANAYVTATDPDRGQFQDEYEYWNSDDGEDDQYGYESE